MVVGREMTEEISLTIVLYIAYSVRGDMANIDKYDLSLGGSTELGIYIG